MAVIDSNNFITHLVWSGLIDKATCGELKEAIELCTVKDIYTKDDVVDMLTELQTEISEHWYNDPSYIEGVHDSEMVVQQKIAKLKGAEDGNE